jgi:hypothetical protein
VRPPGCPDMPRQPVKSRQAGYSLNSLPVHHLPASHSALAGPQWSRIMMSFLTTGYQLTASAGRISPASLSRQLRNSCRRNGRSAYRR